MSRPICVCFAGISESLLESEFQREQSFEDDTEEETTSSMPDGVHESVNVDALSIQLLDDLNLDANHFKRCSPKEIQPKALPLSSSRQELDDILQGMELGDLFLEDVPPYEPSPHELMELQKKETLRELCNERNLGKLKGIWEKVNSSPNKILGEKILYWISEYSCNLQVTGPLMILLHM